MKSVVRAELRSPFLMIKISILLPLKYVFMYVCRVPGSAVASFRNKALILKPAFALDSMNIMPSFVALSSPAIDTSDGGKYANLKELMVRLKHSGIRN